MKIALAQIQSVAGDVEANLRKHLTFIEQAASAKASMIIFPELSLTGYEPTLASELAFKMEDPRLNIFQQLSDDYQMVIGVGVPTRQEAGVCISLLLFQPMAARRVYSKKYLHPDEDAYFVSGQNFANLLVNDRKVAFAICYELSILEHTDEAMAQGAEIYLASVAKSASGVASAHQRLATIARENTIPVLMVNNVGPADDFVGAGSSAVWNKQGELILQLDQEEGLLFAKL
ncbi:MAG: carbon-nitrogen hydrolase family protein [Lewinella sp.]|uniref:carbon-nitrogen hydrolase family protein n=1 Tax=Lewinella sp. TaxID=2004506 RepID=UPI003D6C25DE